jgi:hypothetical protein
MTAHVNAMFPLNSPFEDKVMVEFADAPAAAMLTGVPESVKVREAPSDGGVTV